MTDKERALLKARCEMLELLLRSSRGEMEMEPPSLSDYTRVELESVRDLWDDGAKYLDELDMASDNPYPRDHDAEGHYRRTR